MSQAVTNETPQSPAENRQSALDDKSLLGLGVGLAAALVAGSLCAWTKLPEPATGSVTAIAVAFPAALDLHLKNRRRDNQADAARIRNGELRRPVGLIVALLAAGVLLLDSLVGLIAGTYWHLVAGGSLGENLGLVLSPLATVIVPAVAGVAVFLGAGHASHFLGSRPYSLTAAALGCCVVVRVLVVSLFWESHMAQMMEGLSLSSALWLVVVLHAGYVVIALAGAWFGRSHHNEFLARKLARMERTGSGTSA